MSEPPEKLSRRERLKRFLRGESRSRSRESSPASRLQAAPKHENPTVELSPAKESETTADAPAKSSTVVTTKLPQRETNTTDTLSPLSPLALKIEDKTKLTTARNELWKRAFENLREEQPDLVLVYENLLKDDAEVDPSVDSFTPEVAAAITHKQQSRMEAKQWTYSWFGKSRKVRDTAESILTTIEKVSDLVSVGMSSAPPFVSLPWSMTISLIAFVMSDFEAVNTAVEGLSEMTGVLANYSYAEREFLLDDGTRKDFEDIVLGLYTAIFEYQARVAEYFTRNTLKRLGINTTTAQSWSGAVDKVRNLERSCQTPIAALGVRLSQRNFSNVETLLNKGMKLMERIQRSVISDRAQREKILEWVSPINHFQDHTDIRNLIGDTYLESGRWLLQNETEFLPWKKSKDGVLFLQGVVGSGKTSLTSITIQQILGTEPIAFFYCSANASPREPARTIHNETSNIFQNILAQCALLTDGTISEHVQTSFEHTDRQSAGGCDMTLGTIMSTLKEVLQERGDEQMTFVFDALDECKDQGEFLTCLADLMDSARNLRVFISTRFGIDVGQFFGSYLSISVGAQNSNDIRTYVESEVTRRGSSSMSADQAVRLKNALNTQADGVFRWVVLEIDIFLPRTQRQGGRMLSKDIDRRLEKLETSKAPPVERLFEAYEELYRYALGDDDEASRHFVVKTAMKWVLCSFAQMQANALRHAVSIQPDGTKDEDITIDDILAYCSNFLVKVSGDIIKLAHLSVRQFFEERQCSEFSPPLQHLQVAKTCLYLVGAFFVTEEDQNVSSKSRRIEAYYLPQLRCTLVDGGKALNTFNYYAYLFWSLHCRAAFETGQINDLLDPQCHRDVLFPHLSSLHMSIAKNANHTSQDALGNTVLHRAVLDNDLPTLGLALRLRVLGASSSIANIANKAGNTALHLAAAMGYDMAFHDIVTAGVETDLRNHHNLTALQIAVILNRTPVIRLISQLKLASNDAAGNNLLHYASFFEQIEAIHVLVKAAWPLDAQNNIGQTPLQLAEKIKAIEASNTLSIAQSVAGKPRKRGNDRVARTAADQNEDSPINPLTRRPTRIDPKVLGRPYIVVEDPELSSCQYCNLETWLNASQECVYLSSGDQLLDILDLVNQKSITCKLCAFLGGILHKMAYEESLGKTEDVRVHVRFDVESGGLATGKDVLEISFADVQREVEICLDTKEEAHPLALQWFRGRSIDPKITDSDVFVQLQDWIGTCRDDHRICGRNTGNEYPTFLIDVGSADGKIKPRLIETSQLTEQQDRRFVFLSAPWGKARFFTAHEVNVEELRSGVDITHLAQMHQDAIRFCRALGYRYLWVDALCIIQYENAWAKEITRIGPYCEAADLVIAGSTLMSEPLVPNRERETTFSFTSHLQGANESQQRFTLQLREALKNATTAIADSVLNRAWRLQEAVIPRRLVLFDHEQLIWSCSAVLRSEGSTAALKPWFDPLATLKDRISIAPESHKEVFAYWRSVVQMASRGALSFESDRLSTVEGIANSLRHLLETHSSNAKPCAGLWSTDIHNGLLWISTQPYRETTFRYAGSWGDSRNPPSWTWAFNRAPISYCLCAGLKIETTTEGLLSYISSSAQDRLLIVSALAIDVPADLAGFQHFEFFWDAVSKPGTPDDDLLPQNSPIEAPSIGDKGEDDNSAAKTVPSDRTYAQVMTSMLGGSTFALVAPWTFRPSLETHDARWAGLILKRRSSGLDGFVRKGVFLGPLCDKTLDGWERKELRLK